MLESTNRVVVEEWLESIVNGRTQLVMVGQMQIIDVKNQIEKLLYETQFHDSNAKSCLESIHLNPDFDYCDEFPLGKPVAIMQHSINGGYLIEVLSHDTSNEQIRSVFTLKYLVGENDVWNVIKALTNAFCH